MQKIIYMYIIFNHIKAQHYYKYNYIFGCPNKQYTNTMPWKYPTLNKIMPFVLLFISSPLWIILGMLLFILHPFSGSYYLFNHSNNLAVGRYIY